MENVGGTVLVGSGIKIHILRVRNRQARLWFDTPPGVLVTADNPDWIDPAAGPSKAPITAAMLPIGGRVRIGALVVVKLLGIHGRRVRLGFDAPSHIKVERAVVAMYREVTHPLATKDDAET